MIDSIVSKRGSLTKDKHSEVIPEVFDGTFRVLFQELGLCINWNLAVGSQEGHDLEEDVTMETRVFIREHIQADLLDMVAQGVDDWFGTIGNRFHQKVGASKVPFGRVPERCVVAQVPFGQATGLQSTC